MKQLRVTNIQRGCVYDGPGVRTTIFLKGCTLHCPWCCNPETISADEEWYIDDEKCSLNKGFHSKFCLNCERNKGTISVRQCPFGVSEKASNDYSVEELYDTIIRDKELFMETCGGVTFSGGEPLLYADELEPLLIKLTGNGIQVAMETTLVSLKSNLLKVYPYISCFIVDLKLQPQMKLNDADYIEKITMMLSLINDKPKIIRVVFVDEMLDVKEHICQQMKTIGLTDLEILQCHDLGKKKYEKLDKQHISYSANIEKARSFVEYVNKSNFNAKLLTV